MFELSKLLSARLHLSYYLLKIIYGIIVLVSGLDKFFHFFNASTEGFVSPVVTSSIPLSASTILYIVGAFEICIALLIFSKFTKWGAYMLMAWYVIIILNLLSMADYYMLALSNTGHATANFVLAQLTEFVRKNNY